MKGLLRLSMIVALSIAFAAPAAAQECQPLSGPVLKAGKRFKNMKHVKVWIEYLDASGYTVEDKAGIHYHYNGGVHSGALLYPESYWYDNYPLYFIGQTMRYRIHVVNLDKRPQHNLRVTGIQEYLAFNGKDGKDLPGCSSAEWIVPQLKGKGEWVGEAKYYIPSGTQPGLDQTHVQIQRFHPGAVSPPQLLWDDAQAGLFCPPEE